MRRLKTALGFLTIIPIGNRINEEDIGKSMVFFPIVGLIIGGFLELVRFISLQVFPLILTCILVVFIWSIITGFLHLDGFCDTIDGLAGGKNKEDILRIMEDSAIGAKAVSAIFFLLFLKIYALFLTNTSFSLILAPTMGRWAMVISAIGPYPKPSGLGKAFVNHRKKEDVVFSTIIMLITGILLFKWHFFWTLGISLVFIFLFLYFIKHRLGGVCGDTLGALCEVIEVLCLLSCINSK